LNAVEVGFIVLACTFGGSMFGMALRTALPPSHLASETKDLIKLAMGLVATMTALVLGLLTASAKDSFDSQSKELTDMAANVALLDRALAHYGEETGPSRNLLHSAVAQILHDTWSRGGDHPSQPDPEINSVPSLGYCHGYRKDALAALRTRYWLRNASVPNYTSLLVDHSFHQFRTPGAIECNRDYCVVRLCVCCFKFRLADSDDVYAVPRLDSDL
jgi:hypothetical protein